MKTQIKTSSKIQVATMTATALILAAGFFAALGIKTSGFFSEYKLSSKSSRTFIVDETNSTRGGADSAFDGSCRSEEFGGGTCSLREAVEQANSSGSIIRKITIILPSDTISLSDTSAGDIDITTSIPISIEGSCNNGVVYSILDAASLGERIFDLAAGTNVQIKCALFKDGSDYMGGAISNIDGTLVLNECIFENNFSSREGGAVYSFAPSTSLYISNSSFNNNSSEVYGGALSAYNSSIAISDSSFKENLTNDEQGGAAYFSSPDVKIDETSFVLNSSLDYGGAISLNYDSGNLEITDSEILENTACSGNGVMIFGSDSTVSISDTLIQGNTSEDECEFGSAGGGICSVNSVLTINNSSILENGSSVGGGVSISGGNLTINNSNVSSNNATNYGGAIHIQDGTVWLNNSTLEGNTISSHDHVGDASVVGRVSPDSSIINIVNSTISNNTGGVSALSGPVYIKNTILFNNTNYLDRTVNCIGLIVSGGYNIDGDLDGSPSCGFSSTGDQSGINPMFETGLLADNGGPTQTIALSAESPARDAIPVSACVDFDEVSVSTDQRGVTRADGVFAGSNCDIGAYEYEK